MYFVGRGDDVGLFFICYVVNIVIKWICSVYNNFSIYIEFFVCEVVVNLSFGDGVCFGIFDKCYCFRVVEYSCIC